jgi:hypothetical protein
MKKMLWLCAAVLLIANLLFAAWTNGWLQPWGWQPADPREPKRLEQQLRPEAMQLLPADQRQ